MSPWYSDWFNSPYYHLLYRNRDKKEASRFLDRLVGYLSPSKESRILDIACGKGRHAVYLNSLGYDVTGFDLSSASIAHAQCFENERLHFYINDMRNVLKPEGFDIGLNLFTSFGYFPDDHDNVLALQAMAANIKHGGKLIIDFMNTARVVGTLVEREIRELEGVVFHIRRYVRDGWIYKEIHVEDGDKKPAYREEVRTLYPADFGQLIADAGLTLVDFFGDYSLSPYNEQESDRQIYILKRV